MAVVLVLLSFPLFFLDAASSGQRYYAVSSLEWRSVNEICRYAGVAGPSSFGPVTSDQLLIALERAEKVLPSDNPFLLDVKKRLESEDVIYRDDIGSLGYSAFLSPSAFFQSSEPYGPDGSYAPAWAYDSDWFIASHTTRKSAAEASLVFTLHDALYGRFTIPYRQKVSDSMESAAICWNELFHTNVWGSRIVQNFPFDAGISLGQRGMSLIIGRGKVSLGEGYTGNTAIGDNYDYQEFMKAGFYTRNTSVFLNLTSFDSSRSVNNPWETRISSFSGYRNMRHSAVYELIFSDRAKISLGLLSLLDTDTAFDFRYLNPFMVLHNMYNFHESGILEANNLITFDFSWTPLRKWNVYFQVSVDQIQIPGEAAGYIEDFGYTDPNAIGGLLNLSYTDIIRRGMLNLYGEIVYNMPGMYLNSKYYDENGNVTQKKTGKYCWSQDWLTGYHREEEGSSDMSCSGYRYGGDCLVLSLGSSWRVPSEWSLSSSALYMAHGRKGRGTDALNYTFDGIDTLDTIFQTSLTGTVEHTLVFSLEGSVRIWSDWVFSAGAAYSSRWNYRNTDGLTNSNIQGYVSFTLSTEGVGI